jgi:hypothetical protein
MMIVKLEVCATAPFASVTETTIRAVLAEPAVPETSPVVASRLRPVGKVPEEIA